METKVQGSWARWCGLRSQRRHDIWAAFEFSIFGGLRGAGWESQTGRALHGAPQQVPPGPVSVHWAGDKASHTKGKATVVLRGLTLCLSSTGHSTAHSPQLQALGFL